ncbi:MAG: hypothetical protein EHM58_17250 [Ignavibacteriae bacterium]|nr:MAG: hypothetical protein EHM58_17250 [Ignavibacteriota bacterium]
MKKLYFLFLILPVLYSCNASQSTITIFDYNTLEPIQDLIRKDSVAKAFVYLFKQDVETHNWVYVLSYFDADNFKFQQKIGIDTVQYIAEGLGMNYVDNYLEERENNKGKYSKLDNIIFLDYKGFTKENNVITIYGIAKMYTGGDKRFKIHCIKSGNKMIIVPPLG